MCIPFKVDFRNNITAEIIDHYAFLGKSKYVFITHTHALYLKIC